MSRATVEDVRKELNDLRQSVGALVKERDEWRTTSALLGKEVEELRRASFWLMAWAGAPEHSRAQRHFKHARARLRQLLKGPLYGLRED
jgi:hypothetical protein